MLDLIIRPHGETVDETHGRYCGSRCGFKCSRAKYDYACRRATELAERMGDGWQPEVWENWGWNWKVERGDASIHVNEDKREGFADGYPITGYTCYLNVPTSVQETEHHGGSAVQFISNAETPEDAVGFATQKARTCIARIEESLEKLQ